MSESLLLDKMRSAPVKHNPYYEYYADMIGGGHGIGDVIRSTHSFQRGYGVVQPAFFYQDRDQLGMGIGSFLMNLFRFSKPMLRKGLHQFVDVASKVATDTIEGRNVKESIKQHSKEKANELIAKLPKAFSGVINKTMGSGKKSRSLYSSAVGITRRKRQQHQQLPSLTQCKKRRFEKSAGKKTFANNNKYPLLSLIN